MLTGSLNHPPNYYSRQSSDFGMKDFCSVNMATFGYPAPYLPPVYAPAAPSYTPSVPTYAPPAPVYPPPAPEYVPQDKKDRH